VPTVISERANADASSVVSIGSASVYEGDSGVPMARLRVTLPGPSTDQVSVAYATQDASAVAGSDYVAKSGTLKFAPGQVVKTVAVRIISDIEADDQEFFEVVLSAPSNATLGDDSSAIVTILDDDPGTGLNVTISDSTVHEGDVKNRSVSVNIALSEPAVAPVSVTYTTIRGTAADADLAIKPQRTLNFALGQQFKAVTLAVKADDVAEGDEQLGVYLSSASGAAIRDDRGIVTIVDDEVTAPPVSPLASPPADPEAFWTPPAPLPPGMPGDVIWATTVPGPAGATAYRVLYRSRTVDGADNAVSGWIIVPNGGPVPEGGRPLVAFTHGTTGLADSCAPTRSSTPNSTVTYMADFVAAGYVVAATDYEGLGTPAPATYLTAESEAHAVLDIARAAQRFVPDTSSATVVYGDSQGGHAATAVSQLAPYYAPDVLVVGVVGSGPGVGLQDQLFSSVALSQYRGFLMMAMEGFENAFPGKKLADYFLTTTGLQSLPATENGCANTIVNLFSTTPATTLFEAGALTSPNTLPAPRTTVASLIDRNRIDTRPVTTPVLYVHGRFDPIVQSSMLVPYVQRLCDLGGTVQLRWYNEGHVPASSARTDVLNWISNRFFGPSAPPTSCGAIPPP
jgi:pimeloyl-ACP methyl ester carboxylesterase